MENQIVDIKKSFNGSNTSNNNHKVVLNDKQQRESSVPSLIDLHLSPWYRFMISGLCNCMPASLRVWHTFQLNILKCFNKDLQQTYDCYFDV